MVGLVLLACVLALIDTLFFNAVMAVISVLGVIEMLNATDTLKFTDMSALTIALALFLPFAAENIVWRRMPLFSFFWMILFFILLIKNFGKVNVEQAAVVFMTSILVPLCFASAVYLGKGNGAIARFYLLWALGSAWLCDSGAYFCGSAFGKHKLAPQISPKKTVEGSVGGTIVSVVFMLGITIAYEAVAMSVFGVRMEINYTAIACLTPVFAVLGMLGDLTASVIKRQYGVKDYGHIMPGHGGIMDRFDSVLFTLPAVYILVQQYPVATVVR